GPRRARPVRAPPLFARGAGAGGGWASRGGGGRAWGGGGEAPPPPPSPPPPKKTRHSLIRQSPLAHSSAANCLAKQCASVVPAHLQPCAEGCHCTRRCVTARFVLPCRPGQWW